MSVLEIILEWSEDRPDWQRDALRRLVVDGDLTEEDIEDLSDICKSAHGLCEKQDVSPLDKRHIPLKQSASARITLDSIHHHRGVNALAENQTLFFSPGFTAVYGDNGAGKTGYIRILKNACRARGPEKILGNVVSKEAPLTPSVAIKYSVEGENEIREWDGETDELLLSHVNVFDTQSASVYLTAKTDVAFRPLGLDLFDKLATACKEIRVLLEREQKALNVNGLLELQKAVPAGSTVAKMLEGISPLTKIKTIEALAEITPEEKVGLQQLEKKIDDLRNNDPLKLKKQLTLRKNRIKALSMHLKQIESSLAVSAINSIFEVRKIGRAKAAESKKLRDSAFPKGILEGTGSEEWSKMWETARKYSEDMAYPWDDFPVVDNGALCVLCQQEIIGDTIERLNNFQNYAVSTTERELRELRDKFKITAKAFFELSVQNDVCNETIKEIAVDDEELSVLISKALVTNESRHASIVKTIKDKEDVRDDCPQMITISSEVDTLVKQLDERIEALEKDQAGPELNQLTTSANELRARVILASNKKLVVDEVESKRRLAAYGLCLSDVKTQSITQKSTSVTKSVVTSKLKGSFKDELDNLAFRHMEVELKEAGGSDGVLYHKLVLTRAPGSKLPAVVSEGEQRCLSIAAFFAELSTAEDRSGIVFDDPVSSLDYRWRDGVAKRLILESKKRQVIVFTHDVVFLLLLKQYADEYSVPNLDQHIRQLAIGAGVCSEELPWVALPIKKKIGHLKSKFQIAEKLHKEGQQSAYEKDVGYIYGLLREAWERGLEEVLLGNVVVRYRPGVQTQQVKQIADITDDDCHKLEMAMTKCSRWLPGHDEAAAARAAIPEPIELKKDIDTLEEWVKKIRNRR